MKKIYLTIFICLGFLGLAYNNCSKVSVDSVEKAADAAVTPQTIPDTVDATIANCDEAQAKGLLQSDIQNIKFADTRIESGRKVVCEFKDGPDSDNSPNAFGNMTRKNNFLRARYEQKTDLNVPQNAVICGAEVKADKQQFYYDDMVYFSLNNIVLMSSLKSSLSKTTKQDFSYKGNIIPLYDYNWSKFANSSFEGVNEKADDYCAGKDAGSGDCYWPLSQQNGYIQLGFDPEVVVPITMMSKDGKQTLTLTVTGDNDDKLDCYHEAIGLDVKLYYYIKQ